MNNLIQKTKDTFNNFSGNMYIKTHNFMEKAMISIFTLAGMDIATARAYAAGVNVDNLFGSIIGMVTKIFFYIGSILLVWGIGQLVLAFKNEDADSKSRAVMVIVVSVGLMAVGTFYTKVVGNEGVKMKDFNFNN